MAFLWKILNGMGRSKLVRSSRGLRGGYVLARPPAQITIDDIVRAADGRVSSDRCILGLVECGGDAPCPLHETWKVICGDIEEMLKKTTFATLSRSTETTRSSIESEING